jgi:hypothetical protein
MAHPSGILGAELQVNVLMQLSVAVRLKAQQGTSGRDGLGPHH